MTRQNVFVFFVVTLFFTIAAGSIFSFGDTEDDNMDIYIREHVNSSCSFFEYIFGRNYAINETTECGCAKHYVTRCTTVIYHNETSTEQPEIINTTAASSAAANGEWETPLMVEAVKLDKIPHDGSFVQHQAASQSDDGDDDDSDESEEY